MIAINLLLIFLVVFSVIFLFVVPMWTTNSLPIREIVVVATIMLLLFTLKVGLVYMQAQGKLDVIESYCGKTVSPLSLIFYPEIEDKVILECEQRTTTPTTEVVQ